MDQNHSSKTSIAQFYETASAISKKSIESLLPEGINKEIGHFNVFNLQDMVAQEDPILMPYGQRAFYKIGMVKGKNTVEYADKVIQIENNALVFGTPKIPYNWIAENMKQPGRFCIFTDDFLIPSKSGVVLDELPIFQPGGYPVFKLADNEAIELEHLFEKMFKAITANYLYKYDLLRNLVLEMIHFGQQLQPITSYNNKLQSSTRVSSLFIELLERQFPITSPHQPISLRTAKEYASRLSVNVNYLNKTLKVNTGKTTTEHITARLIQEAKILLRQTDWNISEIAYGLGFEQLSHFSNFFKKQTSLSPTEIRIQILNQKK